jgi:hypothetical protein
MSDVNKSIGNPAHVTQRSAEHNTTAMVLIATALNRNSQAGSGDESYSSQLRSILWKNFLPEPSGQVKFTALYGSNHPYSKGVT